MSNPFTNIMDSIHAERREVLKDQWQVTYAEDVDTTGWTEVRLADGEVPVPQDWFVTNCKHGVAAYIYPTTDYDILETTDWPAFLFENKNEALLFKLAYGGKGGADTY